MRLAIASNVVVDEIVSSGMRTTRLGGPPCYCGIAARNFKFNVRLATKIGRDLLPEYVDLLRSKEIDINGNDFTDEPTTRFELIYGPDGERQLFVKSRCSQIRPDDIWNDDADAWIVSPVADEVPGETLDAIKRKKKNAFLMMDPQGYLREIDYSGKVSVSATSSIDLNGIDAIKADPEELKALTGGKSGHEAMISLKTRGIKSVIATEHRTISLLHGGTIYWMKLKDIDTPDPTGAGDILSAAFTCAFVKENDPLWALCFGAGAVSAALESRKSGLDKIPAMSKIEQNASYFYNMVGFRKLE